MLAALFTMLALAWPTPDPPPQACFQGWCSMPTFHVHIDRNVTLPGLPGLWDCRVGRRWTYCTRVG
jgi:hypothetical protein